MKNILLAVIGLSPQVLTETLYALHQSNRKVDAIHVITTREGKEKIYGLLLSGEAGQYYQYLKEYGIDPATIDFSHNNIHVIRNEHGVEIPDIASESDNEHLLKICLDLAFRFTRDPQTSVLFSIAGGRKTMSPCLSLAAQFYGRFQDRLYHVLVSPEYESNRQFFYPPKESKWIELTDKQGHPVSKETQYAEINLVHIPFVSIRNQLSGELLTEPKDPGTLMLSLIREEEARLIINLILGKIVYKNVELDMMAARMALYTFFAIQKKNCASTDKNCRDCTACFLDIQSIFEKQGQITDLYQRMSGSRPIGEMSDSGIVNLSQENFMMYKGKIKNDFLKRFGAYALRDLEIASIGSRPNTMYGILIDKGKLEIVY